LDKIKLEIKPVAQRNKQAKFFILGSSLRQKSSATLIWPLLAPAVWF